MPNKLIIRRLIGFLVGFPLQHSSVRKQCHDSNHDEKDDAEDKHHTAVPVRPVALVARSFHNLMERQGCGLGVMDYFNWRHTIGMMVSQQRISVSQVSRRPDNGLIGCLIQEEGPMALDCRMYSH